MSELLPCPFCGGEARWFWNGTVSAVRCMTCHASVDNNLSPTEDKEARRSEAIAAWNSRAERTCFADEVTHRDCKYSVNRGWKERTCHWELEHSGTLYDKWRCSKCGYLYVDSRTDGGVTGLDPKFCPHCGAKVIA